MRREGKVGGRPAKATYKRPFRSRDNAYECYEEDQRSSMHGRVSIEEECVKVPLVGHSDKATPKDTRVRHAAFIKTYVRACFRAYPVCNNKLTIAQQQKRFCRRKNSVIPKPEYSSRTARRRSFSNDVHYATDV